MRLHALILAAGLSSRYGTKNENKLMADVDGRPMYTYILERLIDLKEKRDDIDDLTIVTQRGPIFDQCRHDKRVMCVENRFPEDGISSSLKIGLTTAGCLIASEFRSAVRAISDAENDRKVITGSGNRGRGVLEEEHALVCFVGDQPYLSEETIEAFLDGYKASGKKMGALSLDGTPYNPCCFRDDCWDDLAELSGDTGGKQIIRRSPDDVYYYQLPDERRREVEDIDYKEELPC